MNDSFDVGRLMDNVRLSGQTYGIVSGKASGYAGVIMRLAYASGSSITSLGDRGYVLFRVMKMSGNAIAYKDYSLYCSDASHAKLKGIGGTDSNGITCALGFETDASGRSNCNVYLLSDGVNYKYAYQILYSAYPGAIDAMYNINFTTAVNSIPNKQNEV
jgi:hypothetical protein